MKHKPMKSINFQKLLPKGSVLVFSLLILSIMLVTSLTILSSAVLDRKATLSTGSSTRSFQVADSGVEEVLYQIYKETRATPNAIASAITGGSCLNGVISFPVAGGDAEVTLYQDETTVFTDCTDADWRDSVVKIKSEGTAGPTTRAVEVAVAAAGNGISSCPSGFVLVGTSGTYSASCIEEAPRAAATTYAAKTTCMSISDATLGRAHLCDHNEWYEACKLHAGSLTAIGSDWEKIADFDDADSGGTGQMIVGSGGCDTSENNNTTTLNKYRCCY